MADTARRDTRRGGPLGRARWVAIAGVVVLAFVVSRSCQKSQIRLTKDQAIARAEAQVKFKPTNEQVRLLRQGLSSHPMWIVSLSIPRKDGTFAKLAVVRVDANTGKIVELRVQRGSGR